MEFEIQTARGRRMLKPEGHCYIFDEASKSDPEILFWRCERKDVCKARLHYKTNKILKVLNEHSHEIAPHIIDYRTVATSLKNRAEKNPGTTICHFKRITEISRASQFSFAR